MYSTLFPVLFVLEYMVDNPNNGAFLLYCIRMKQCTIAMSKFLTIINVEILSFTKQLFILNLPYYLLCNMYLKIKRTHNTQGTLDYQEMISNEEIFDINFNHGIIENC